MRVHLWDLSGSTEYIDVRNELYIQADAIFMAFDVTNQATFDALDSWLKEIQRYTTGTPDLIVVANKVCYHTLKYYNSTHKVILNDKFYWI